MSNKRIEWIDTARGINIFLVVLGHTILPHSWLVYVFSFHMPLFFLLSGYLYNPQKYPDWKEFTKRRINTILWPYVIFSALNYIYWVFFFNSKNYLDPLWQMLYSSDKLFAPFIPLWFLTCLFVVEILFYFMQKKLKPLQLFFAIIILTIVGFWLANNHIPLVWGIDIALIGLLFYYLGYNIKIANSTIKILNFKWISLVGLGLLIINYIFAHYNNYQFSMIYRAYNKDWLFVLVAISGSIGYLILAKILKETIFKKTGIWEFLGQNSLIILGLHTVFYYFVSDFFRNYLQIHPQTSVIYAFIYTIITLILITPIIFLINKKLPFLVGRPMLKEKNK